MLLNDRRITDTLVRSLLAVVLFAVFPPFSDVYRLWERFAGNPSFTYIPFEYPPVSALFYAPFDLLPSSRWAVAINGLLMVAAATWITWLLVNRLERRELEGSDLDLWAAAPSLLILLPIGWDALVTGFALMGALALRSGRAAKGGVWHGLGTAFKVFPGAMVIPLAAWLRGRADRVAYLTAGAVGLVVPYLVYAWAEPADWDFHLTSASTRDDFESSVWGVVVEVMAWGGVDVPLQVVNVISVITSLLLLFAIAVWVSRRPVPISVASSLAVLAFLFSNKVFKPQYVLWMLPFLAWAGVKRRPVRLVEATAIGHFALVYLLAPPYLLTVLAVVRTVGFGLIARDLVRVANRQIPAGVGSDPR